MSTEDTSHQAFEEFRQRLADLQRDLEGLASSAKAAAREKLSDVREGAAAYCHESTAKVQGIEQSIEHRIAEHPFKSLLAALGVGLVLGVLWRRR